jgi:iron complex outermembrane receptor protein
MSQPERIPLVRGFPSLLPFMLLMAACPGGRSVALAEVPNQAAGEGASATLQEVVVTAQKRSEDLQKTPVSVTAISGSEAAELNIQNFQDLAGFVPSLEVTPQPSGAANLTIRGLGQSSDRVNQDVKTGLYINDMYVAKQEGNFLSFYDVESLQVLKGPQGTLFGKNTTGGAILLTSVLPSNDNR